MSATRKDIIYLPNKHLRQTSKKVSVVDEEVKKIIQDMETATLDWEDSRKHEVGVALAAIQINKPLRIIVIRNNFDNKEDRSFQVFINPKVVKLEGKVTEDYEGCLSVRTIYGLVPRHEKARIKALDINGNEVRLKVDGFLARVFQHEIDHTNGIVFVDHIKDKPEAFFRLLSDGKLEPLNYDEQIKDNKALFPVNYEKAS